MILWFYFKLYFTDKFSLAYKWNGKSPNLYVFETIEMSKFLRMSFYSYGIKKKKK